MAIANYTKICLLQKIPQEVVQFAQKLILGHESARESAASRPRALCRNKRKARPSTTARVDTLSLEDKPKFAIIDGEKSVGDGANQKILKVLLEDTVASHCPLEWINTVWLDGNEDRSPVGHGAKCSFLKQALA